ncbi:MAG: RHS repeat-associated core domain-containing protein, partial [Nitrosomonadales bacterium]|nr:RHS repeat-associated core domain-containing protein [Nitrosomonadales bacterium]
LDTPRVITDTAGNTVWSWSNDDPFGNNVPNENPAGLGTFKFDLRFPGQVADKETNTFYNFLRDAYDPALGRYTQFDPIGLTGGINGYTYAFNTPIIAIDPTGLYCIFSDGVIIKLTPTSTTRKMVEREWETLLAVPVPSPNVPSPSMGFPWPGMELMWQVTKHQSGYLERLFKSTMGGIWRCYDDCGKMTFQGWGTKEGPDQWQKDGNFEDSSPGKTHRGGSPSPDDLPRIPQPRIPR